MVNSAYKKVSEAKEFVTNKCALKPVVGIVLGSGLGTFASQVKDATVISYEEIPHFVRPKVLGHGGKLLLGRIGGVPVAVLQGRVHYYEGHSPETVVLPVRMLGLLGVESVLLTNASGGINTQYQPGDLVAIRDHVNMTGNNPLIGENVEEFGTRFPDMTDLYSSRIREAMRATYEDLKVRYFEGVYFGLSGPTYETPAEVEYLRRLGADAVGMSTVYEAIALRHMGIEVAGISCITNLAAGITGEKLSHDDITETSKKVEVIFAKILNHLIPRIVS